MVVLSGLTGLRLFAAAAALMKARALAKRLERLSESYWELRYEHGQLRARVQRLDPEAIPPTIVTYEIARLKQFMAEQGGEMIVKPLDGHGGEGVFHAHSGDRNLNAILETVTRLETRPIMGQR